MTPPASEETTPVYAGESRWNADLPRALAVCCSDGRLQTATDEFLHGHLGVSHYDRFYAPGGPGALTPGGHEFLRATQYREDLAFLVRAHGIQKLLLIFHGVGPDGPSDSACAYYRRVLPGADTEAIAQQQARDLADLLGYLRDLGLAVQVRAFRAEVLADRGVRFVPLATE